MNSLANNAQEKAAILCLGKTGGTSLSNILHGLFGARCLREFQQLPFNVLGHFYRDSLEIFLRQMPRSIFDEIKLIVGHIPVGLGDVMPGTTFQYATIMREPIGRVISTYFYINHQHFVRTDPTYLNAMLHRTISLGNDVVFSEPLVRVLSGSEALVPREQSGRWTPLEVTKADCELAIRNLRNFAFIGLTERFTDSVKLLLSQLGSSCSVTTREDNITPIRLRLEDVHPDTIDAIAGFLKFDQLLYREAVHRFDQDAKRAGLAPHHHLEQTIKWPRAISSGDHSHLASATSAFSDRREGVWISAVQSPEGTEWLGQEFDEACVCKDLCIQLLPIPGSSVSFQIEASNDGFRHDLAVICGAEVACDGEPHKITFRNDVGAFFWRLRCVRKPNNEPLKIAYVKFSPQFTNSPRDMETVLRQIKAAESIEMPDCRATSVR